MVDSLGRRTWATTESSSIWDQRLLLELQGNEPGHRKSYAHAYVQTSGGTQWISIQSGEYKENALKAYRFGRAMETHLNLRSRLQTDHGKYFAGYSKYLYPRPDDYIPNHEETKLIASSFHGKPFSRSYERLVLVAAISRSSC